MKAIFDTDKKSGGNVYAQATTTIYIADKVYFENKTKIAKQNSDFLFMKDFYLL